MDSTQDTAASTPAGDRTGARTRRALPPQERRAALVAAAQEVFAAKGISRTTTSDVARAAGVTRGLVYHYFPTTDDLVDAVLERHAAEFAERVRAWDAARRPGEIEQPLRDLVVLFRDALRHGEPWQLDLQRVENAALYRRFVDRAVEAVVDCLQVTTVEAFARRHRIRIDHVRDTFTVLVHGLVGLARSRPDVPVEVMVDITRQVLRLDLAEGDGAPGEDRADEGRRHRAAAD